MGNCGVGFAPCRPEDHDTLVRLMEGVEDIPGVVLAEGLSWSWETFPEFLDALEARPHDVDLATQLPHGALRVYVMGQRGADREPATAADIAAMARIAREAVEAGALGFSTSRTLNHRTSDGHPTPTLTAAEDELLGVARALGEAGKGVLQFVSDFKDAAEEMGMLRRLVEQSGRPLSVSLVQATAAPDSWRRLLGWIEEAAGAGLPMRAQVAGRPVGLMLGLETTMNPFVTHPSWREVAGLPLPEKVARLRDPAFRTRLLGEQPGSNSPFLRGVLQNFDKMFVLGDPPDYEPAAEDSIAARAEARGVPPADLAYDLLLEDGGHALLYRTFLNYSDYNLDVSREMLLAPNTVPGLGDAGAHCGVICDGSFPSFLMLHYGRDRTRGDKLELEWLVKRQTADTAALIGLDDRGTIEPGRRADLNLIDWATMQLHHPEIRFDLPAGGKRLVQRIDGYRMTLVAGESVCEDGRPTGAMPGRLVRHASTA
jgi:N-acyl-D-aspartate/D-glutamate deacylase